MRETESLAVDWSEQCFADLKKSLCGVGCACESLTEKNAALGFCAFITVERKQETVGRERQGRVGNFTQAGLEPRSPWEMGLCMVQCTMY